MIWRCARRGGGEQRALTPPLSCWGSGTAAASRRAVRGVRAGDRDDEIPGGSTCASVG